MAKKSEDDPVEALRKEIVRELIQNSMDTQPLPVIDIIQAIKALRLLKMNEKIALPGNEGLFLLWKKLYEGKQREVAGALLALREYGASIAQNPMEIGIEDVEEWKQGVYTAAGKLDAMFDKGEIDDLVAASLTYVKKHLDG